MRIGQRGQPTGTADAHGTTQGRLRIIGDAFQLGATAGQHHLPTHRTVKAQIAVLMSAIR